MEALKANNADKKVFIGGANIKLFFGNIDFSVSNAHEGASCF